MTTRYLLDTSIVSSPISKQPSSDVLERLEAHGHECAIAAPVWHELTAPLRASGELVLVGITEEQHPDRCALFAQWQGFDWPILWDPFNLTRSAAVPAARRKED